MNKIKVETSFPYFLNFKFLLIISIFLLLSPVNIFACEGDHDCEPDVVCTNGDIQVTEYSCSGGSCQSEGTEIIAESESFHHEFCSGGNRYEKIYTCEVDGDGNPCIVESDENLIESCQGDCFEDGDGSDQTTQCINLPTVETDPPSDIDANNATLHGELLYLGDNADSVEVYFEWGIEGEGMPNTTSADTLTSPDNFSSSISVNPGETYEFRAVAENDGGRSSGDEFTFDSIQDPEVTTDPASSIGAYQARLNGQLDYMGGSDQVEVWFEWGETTGMNKTTSRQTLSSTDSYNQLIDEDINEGETYYFRAVAENDSGRVEGEIREFVTIDYGTVTTDGYSNLTHESVDLHGTVTDMGGDSQVEVAFLWGEDGNIDRKTTTQTMNSTGEFTISIDDDDDLDYATDYTFRAEVSNTAGSEYGGFDNFTTNVVAPSVKTLDTDGIGGYVVNVYGEVEYMGGDSQVDVWFEWWEEGNSEEINVTEKMTKDEVGRFGYTIDSGLEQGATYWYRAVIENELHKIRADEAKTFTTIYEFIEQTGYYIWTNDDSVYLYAPHAETREIKMRKAD